MSEPKQVEGEVGAKWGLLPGETKGTPLEGMTTEPKQVEGEVGAKWGLLPGETKGTPLEGMTKEQKVDELITIIMNPENNLDAIGILRDLILESLRLDDRLRFARGIANGKAKKES